MKYIKEFNNFLINESINDKGLLKLIIVTGSPGSGKSSIVKTMFSGTEARIFNYDFLQEFYMRRSGIDMNYNNRSEDIERERRNIRKHSYNVMRSQVNHWYNSMLPIVFDTTGQNESRILEYRNVFQNLGYDVYMIYVYANLETSLFRNSQRERQAEEEYVRSSWIKTNSNIKNLYIDEFIDSEQVNAEINKIERTLKNKSLKEREEFKRYYEVFSKFKNITWLYGNEEAPFVIMQGGFTVINNNDNRYNLNSNKIEYTQEEKKALWKVMRAYLYSPLTNKKGCQLLDNLRALNKKYQTELTEQPSGLPFRDRLDRFQSDFEN